MQRRREAPLVLLLLWLDLHWGWFSVGVYHCVLVAVVILEYNIVHTLWYHRPGDKRQLKAQDVTAKLVRFDILRKSNNWKDSIVRRGLPHSR